MQSKGFGVFRRFDALIGGILGVRRPRFRGE